jgi:hypothetical protein
LPKDDPDFAKIQEETKDEMVQLFIDAVVPTHELQVKPFFKGSASLNIPPCSTRLNRRISY